MKFYRNYSRFILLGFLGLGLGSSCQTKLNKAGDQPSTKGEEDPGDGTDEHPKNFSPDKLLIAPIALSKVKTETGEDVFTNFQKIYVTPGLKASPLEATPENATYPNILAFGPPAKPNNGFSIVVEVSKNHYFVITKNYSSNQLWPAFLEADPSAKKDAITFQETKTVVNVSSQFLAPGTASNLQIVWSVSNGKITQPKSDINFAKQKEYSLTAKVETSKNGKKYFYYFCPQAALYDDLQEQATKAINEGKGFTLTQLYNYLLAANDTADTEMKIDQKIITEITALKSDRLENFNK